MNASSIILHHDEATAGSLRVAKVLALKKAAWKSARLAVAGEAPGALDKILTGAMGQPILQRGHQFWVSDLAVIDALEELFPEPTLFPNGNRGMPLALVWWSDEFASRKGDLSQMAAHAALIGRQLADGRAFLQGSEPGLADVNAYAGIRLAFEIPDAQISGKKLEGSHLSRPLGNRRVLAWYERVEALGLGDRETIEPQVAWEQPECDSVRIDEECTVKLTRPDTGAWLEGCLCETDADRIVVTLENEAHGPIRVHFPAIGYHLDKGGQSRAN